MKHIFNIVTAGLLLTSALTACTDHRSPPLIPLDEFKPVTVRATSDIALPSAAAHITFVPNSIAPWLGHILIVADDGKIYRTDGQGHAPTLLADISARDAFGLFRQAASGVFLTITPTGSLSAYIHASEENEFAPMILSSNLKVAARKFCEGGDPLTGSAGFLSQSNEIVRFSISDIGPGAIEIQLAQPVKLDGPVTDCAVSAQGIITLWPETGGGSVLKLDPQDTLSKSKTPELRPDGFFQMDQDPITLSTRPDPAQFALSRTSGNYLLNIEDGLSISAPGPITVITGTANSFGGTFNNGVIVVGSNQDEPRLVLISLDYINRELEQMDQRG